MIDNQTRDSILKVRDKAAKKGIEALFSLHREKSHLMRIGNNSISLSTSVDLTRLDVSVIDGQKEGSYTAMGNMKKEENVESALNMALEKAALATPKEYEPLKKIVEQESKEDFQHDPQLENILPETKANIYREIMNKTGDKYNYSGSWDSGSTEIFLTGTSGQNTSWHKGTDQQFSCVLKHPEHKWELASYQTGWQEGTVKAEKTATDFNRVIDIYKQPGHTVKPGEYTILLGAQAISEIIGMLLWSGFEGRKYEDKISWTSENKIGDKILSEKVTIIDDPGNMDTFRFGFDLNGKARDPFAIVKEGKIANIIYDIDTAGKYGKKPTAHNASYSIVMKPGEGPECPLEGVKNMGKVLFIPALHYVHIPNQSKGIFTGSSRFSAVLLENGKMVSPIFSSRITDSFQNVLSNIELLSSKSTSINQSSSYGRRMPEAFSVPNYMVSSNVKITDSADSF